jgi:hypothetical protein
MLVHLTELQRATRDTAAARGLDHVVTASEWPPDAKKPIPQISNRCLQ